MAAVLFAVILAVAAGSAALAAFRYLPALDEARALRSDLEATVDRVQEAGLELDRATVDALEVDVAGARARLDGLHGLVSSDPLIGVARVLPPTAVTVTGADRVLAAGDSILDAAGEALVIASRYVDIREKREAGPDGGSTLAQLVELMATTRGQALAAAAAVEDARLAIQEVPPGAMPQIEAIRDALSERIERYGPLLDAYTDASDRLPAILGWDEPRRYLILTQDPAELRPSGGLIGSYGIIAFERGRITERRFLGVTALDEPWDFPFVTPPQELADYLLGPEQPWQFADAGWSPDFPTSARDALRLYVNESGDTDFDGVLGITTYTIDALLEVTGPVEVSGYGVTIASGETTLKVLQETRSAAPGEDRKAFLSAFADSLFEVLLSLPPESWGGLLDDADSYRDARLLLGWFTDPADQALASRLGLDGAVRTDLGDYLYPVDANVAPASKLNAWTTRSLSLDVEIDDVGNARNTLEVTWSNGVETPAGASYREMEGVGGHILGMYFRILVPERSRVEAVEGGTLASVAGPAVVAEEAGRLAIGSYLMIPPGSTTLRYAWTSPYAADVGLDGGIYRLMIQLQPGMLPGPLRVTIHVPDGGQITAASPELVVSGQAATMDTTLSSDVSVGVAYLP